MQKGKKGKKLYPRILREVVKGEKEGRTARGGEGNHRGNGPEIVGLNTSHRGNWWCTLTRLSWDLRREETRIREIGKNRKAIEH